MLCVKAQLISSRLLSKEDKQDMLSGLISVEDLIVQVKAWIEAGMPDYANGKFEPYRHKREEPLSRYRGIGKS